MGEPRFPPRERAGGERRSRVDRVGLLVPAGSAVEDLGDDDEDVFLEEDEDEDEDLDFNVGSDEP